MHAAVQDPPRPKPVQQATFRQADDYIDPLVKTLHELQRYAENGDIISALQACARLKKDGVQPDLRVYGYLCKIFASRALWPEVTALCHDAVAVGLTLDINLYNWKLVVSGYFIIALCVSNAQIRPMNIHGRECGKFWMKWRPTASHEMQRHIDTLYIFMHPLRKLLPSALFSTTKCAKLGYGPIC